MLKLVVEDPASCIVIEYNKGSDTAENGDLVDEFAIAFIEKVIGIDGFDVSSCADGDMLNVITANVVGDFIVSNIANECNCFVVISFEIADECNFLANERGDFIDVAELQSNMMTKFVRHVIINEFVKLARIVNDGGGVDDALDIHCGPPRLRVILINYTLIIYI
jgi:hypothetical protein